MDKNNKESIFIKKYPLIFKKYRPLRKISNGAFSEIYYGININNNKKIAIKTEYRHTLNKLLESESFLLFSLKGLGIPKVLSFGHNKEYDILIMPLLGKSLKELYLSKNSNFEFKDICLMAIQIIERIKWVHSHNVIHRDIKPDNFLIGLEDPNIIYLIDFGLSKKYKSSTTGKHISFSEVKKFTGTLLYASSNALRFKEQSRRDDLESICYMIIYLMKGSLPWQKLRVNNKKQSYMKVGLFKRNIRPEKLCENLPGEMIDFVNYVKKLQFEEEPDYYFLKNLFEIMLKKGGGQGPGNLFFSWINEKYIKKLKKPVDYSKRTSTSRERIFKKIRKSLDNKRCISDLKQNTDYNLKIKSYLDDKVFDKMKYYNISTKTISDDNSNEKQHINYVNNSINNNYITISVSISNSNNLNSNKENKNMLLNSVSSLRKNAIYGNLNKIKNNNNECIEKFYNTNFKRYQDYSPDLILNKNNIKIVPYIEYDINSNSNFNTIDKNYGLKNRNKIISDITYDKEINYNNYNKKITLTKNIEKDKSSLYKTNRNYNYNRSNNQKCNTNIYNNRIFNINNNRNINPKNFKEKILNIKTPKNFNNMKNESQSVTNNNELMREIKNFNLRFNYRNNNDEKRKKNIRRMKVTQSNKSAEQTKCSYFKKRINIQLNNTENNCFIF